MELSDLAIQYDAATQAILDAVTRVAPEQLDHHDGDGWSARQVIHHVADSETNSYVRLRRLLAEPAGTVIQGYDEAAWASCAALGYEDLDPAHSLEVFRAVRQASSDVLRRLTPSDLERHGTHTEGGHYTLARWIEIYTQHPRDHAAQLLAAAGL